MDMDFWYDLMINNLEHLIDVAELGGTKSSREWPPTREPVDMLTAMSPTGRAVGMNELPYPVNRSRRGSREPAPR